MATQEEKELRKKVLEDIRRKRAAAAQAEGVVGAAEEGQYGDVGQGGPKGEFDDEIDQGRGNEDPTVSAIVSNPNLSKENLMKAAEAGSEAALYMTPIVGDVLSGYDSVRAMDAAIQAEDLVDKIKLGGLSFLAAAGALPLVSTVYDRGGPAVKKMIDDAINEALGPKLATAGGLDNFGIGNLFNLLKRDDPRVKDPGTGKGKPGIGTERGPKEREIVISNQRQFVNTKLQEIWDNAPKIKKEDGTVVADLPANWFSSKETKRKIYDENPVLFTEWKDGIGSWNDFTNSFLAGKIVKRDGKNFYTGEDAVTASKLPVSGALSPSAKATKDFQETVAKKLNVDSINPQDQTLKFLNFIRLSESETLLNDPTKFFKKHKFEDLNTPGTKLNENFEKFKVLDNKRITLRDDPDIRNLMQKIFPDIEIKFDIAHTFESGLVRQKRVSKELEGAGGDPDKMYIDISYINRDVQKELEKQARKLEGIFSNVDLSPELRREAMIGLEAINTKLTGMGVQGQTVTQVGDTIQSGFILGSKDVKFSNKIANIAEDRGVKLNDKDYETLLRADNIINPPKEIMEGTVQLKNRGGMMSIFDMTRPLNAQR